MSGNDQYFLNSVVSNDSIIALSIKFSFNIVISCITNPLGSAPHIFLYLNSKRNYLKDCGAFNGIKTFPFIGLALLDELISLANKSIY